MDSGRYSYKSYHAKHTITMSYILASNSPRRRSLLSYILPDFDIAPSRDIDESFPENLPVEEVAPYLSRVKADGYKDLVADGDILITADTVVILDGKILGKPKTESGAIEMLKALSGQTHTVVTGVTLMSPTNTDTFSETTHVTFDKLSDKQIESYVAEFKPLDKAGAYGIQEGIGATGISGIVGCFYNVMGLPLHTLNKHLDNFNGL